MAARRTSSKTKSTVAKVAGILGTKALAAATGSVIAYNRRKGHATRASWLTAIPVIVGGAFELFGPPESATTKIASTMGTAAAAAGMGDALAAAVIEAQGTEKETDKEEMDQLDSEEQELLNEGQRHERPVLRRAAGAFVED